MKVVEVNINKIVLLDLLNIQYSLFQDSINNPDCHSVLELQYNSLLFFIVCGLKLFVYRDDSGHHYVTDDEYDFISSDLTRVFPFSNCD